MEGYVLVFTLPFAAMCGFAMARHAFSLDASKDLGSRSRTPGSALAVELLQRKLIYNGILAARLRTATDSELVETENFDGVNFDLIDNMYGVSLRLVMLFGVLKEPPYR